MITTITTTIGEFLAIKVPKDAEGLSITYNATRSWLRYTSEFAPKYRHLCNLELPSGQWDIIDFASKLTEEQCALIVPHEIETEYPEIGSPYDYPVYEGGHDTATDAFAELLGAKGIHYINPYEEPCELDILCFGLDEFNRNVAEWQSEQEKVYDPLILKAR